MYKPLPRCPNGMLLPPLDGYLRNATQRLKDIQHLQTREEDILVSSYPKSDFIYGEWCQYELQWEKFYKSGNVLVLRYEEMKADEVECVRKIAEYLSIPCDKETASRIASECNIFKVRERKKSRIFGYLYRKGEVGDWKNHFSSTQQEKFSLLFKERLRDSSLSTYFQ
ncbi:sulfotransferase 6B1-like isoform X2 [Saccostrea echinata]|uniref:sulfotransferase 6B1-like isoform X2 n=1 Tax=Saccostrea echinata TaxID=191078 RepID=UPI002A80836F|nr:sulfotransferase 6B1-like isoform X2 [Saccostrea echinata]